jgi:hypothetical protein
MAKNVKKAKNDLVTNKSATTKMRRLAKDTADVNPEYTDAFIQEIDEDVKNDNLKQLWEKYGVFIVLLVVLAVSATVSFEKFKSWRAAQNQAATETYMSAVQLKENPEETLAALQQINQSSQGIFSDFAKLQIANVLFNQNKNDEAKATLQSLIDDQQVNAEVKNIALIKLATYMVDELPKAEFEAMLKPILDANNSWTPLAQDLLAMSAIKEGDVDTARTIYENILKIKDLPDNFKTKIQDMLTSLSDM